MNIQNYIMRKGDVILDVYEVCEGFNIQDPSGCIHHAIKKLLLGGKRNGGKGLYQDITEARDTLNRWLDIQKNLNESA
jgi:hypothetical protein